MDVVKLIIIQMNATGNYGFISLNPVKDCYGCNSHLLRLTTWTGKLFRLAEMFIQLRGLKYVGCLSSWGVRANHQKKKKKKKRKKEEKKGELRINT